MYIRISKTSEAGVDERLCGEGDWLRCYLSPTGEWVITTGKYHAMQKKMVPAKDGIAVRCKETKGLLFIFNRCERCFARAKLWADRATPIRLSVLGTSPTR
jgi:hypothetical protein